MDTKVISTIIAGVFSVVVIIVKFYLNRKEKNTDREIDLNDHPIFSRIKYLISQIDYSLEFKSVGRYMLVSDVMETYFYIVGKRLKELADEVNELERRGDSFNIHELHMKYLNEIIEDLTDLKSYNNLKLNEESEETLKLFISKFQKWHSKRRDILIERSGELSNSYFYKEDIVKVAALFDAYIGILASTLHDGSKTLHELNGELQGKKYRGRIINGVESHGREDR